MRITSKAMFRAAAGQAAADKNPQKLTPAEHVSQLIAALPNRIAAPYNNFAFAQLIEQAADIYHTLEKTGQSVIAWRELAREMRNPLNAREIFSAKILELIGKFKKEDDSFSTILLRLIKSDAVDKKVHADAANLIADNYKPTELADVSRPENLSISAETMAKVERSCAITRRILPETNILTEAALQLSGEIALKTEAAAITEGYFDPVKTANRVRILTESSERKRANAKAEDQFTNSLQLLVINTANQILLTHSANLGRKENLERLKVEKVESALSAFESSADTVILSLGLPEEIEELSQHPFTTEPSTLALKMRSESTQLLPAVTGLLRGAYRYILNSSAGHTTNLVNADQHNSRHLVNAVWSRAIDAAVASNKTSLTAAPWALLSRKMKGEEQDLFSTTGSPKTAKASPTLTRSVENQKGILDEYLLASDLASDSNAMTASQSMDFSHDVASVDGDQLSFDFTPLLKELLKADDAITQDVLNNLLSAFAANQMDEDAIAEIKNLTPSERIDLIIKIGYSTPFSLEKTATVGYTASLSDYESARRSLQNAIAAANIFNKRMFAAEVRSKILELDVRLSEVADYAHHELIDSPENLKRISAVKKVAQEAAAWAKDNKANLKQEDIKSLQISATQLVLTIDAKVNAAKKEQRALSEKAAQIKKRLSALVNSTNKIAAVKLKPTSTVSKLKLLGEFKKAALLSDKWVNKKYKMLRPKTARSLCASVTKLTQLVDQTALNIQQTLERFLQNQSENLPTAAKVLEAYNLCDALDEFWGTDTHTKVIRAQLKKLSRHIRQASSEHLSGSRHGLVVRAVSLAEAGTSLTGTTQAGSQGPADENSVFSSGPHSPHSVNDSEHDSVNAQTEIDDAKLATKFNALVEYVKRLDRESKNGAAEKANALYNQLQQKHDNYRTAFNSRGITAEGAAKLLVFTRLSTALPEVTYTYQAEGKRLGLFNHRKGRFGRTETQKLAEEFDREAAKVEKREACVVLNKIIELVPTKTNARDPKSTKTKAFIKLLNKAIKLMQEDKFEGAGAEKGWALAQKLVAHYNTYLANAEADINAKLKFDVQAANYNFHGNSYSIFEHQRKLISSSKTETENLVDAYDASTIGVAVSPSRSAN